MNTERTIRNKGIIMEIVVIIVALVLLKFVFKVDVLAWIKSDAFQEALAYIKEIVMTLWKSISGLSS